MTRSVFVTSNPNSHMTVPNWFFDKYSEYVHFRNGQFPISSISSYTSYGVYDDIPTDIQKILIENNSDHNITIMWHHDNDGGMLESITCTKISKDSIKHYTTIEPGHYDDMDIEFRTRVEKWDSATNQHP